MAHALTRARSWWHSQSAGTRRWMRVGFVVALVLLVGLVAGQRMDFVGQATGLLVRANPWWFLAATLTGFGSFLAFGIVQKILLTAGGVPVRLHQCVGLALAANAWAVTVPGGQGISTALTYRVTRDWGASRALASWQLLMSGILATLGLILLAVVGFVLIGNPPALVLAALGAAGCALLVAITVRGGAQLQALYRPLIAVVGPCAGLWGPQVRRRWEQRLHRIITSLAAEASTIQLGRRPLAVATAWSMANWVIDAASLACAAYAVGAEPSLVAVIIGFVTAKVAGMLQFTPGGVGTVDVAMTTTLIAAGLPAAAALATVLLYRLINWVGVAIVGGSIFAVSYAASGHPSPAGNSLH